MDVRKQDICIHGITMGCITSHFLTDDAVKLKTTYTFYHVTTDMHVHNHCVSCGDFSEFNNNVSTAGTVTLTIAGLQVTVD